MNLTDGYTFNGGKYRPILTDDPLLTPIPESQASGEWVHIPYGGNIFEDDNTSRHTTWQVQVVILTPSDYALIRAKYKKFASLTTPFGTFNARLAEFSVQKHAVRNYYQGSCTFEWS